jgi:DNA-binding SARP family transcriptional activator
VEFRILGPTEVLDGGRRVPLPGGRGRALLALLVLHAGEPVSADRLIDELWGESPPPTARTVVHGLVSRLRGLLEPGRGKARLDALLQTLGSGYRLAIEPDAVDAHRFKRLIDEARSAPAEVRAPKLSAALALWRGPPLADFAYEPFAQRAITALEELRTQAIEDRIEADLASGRAADLVPELEELIRIHPFRERLRGLLMLALYRSGRQADALQAYRDAGSLLAEELGLEPGPALRELETAILRQDPALELPPTDRARTGPPGLPGSWLPRERRTVTVAVLDVAPSANPDADAEAVGSFGAHCARVAAEVLERHGGRVERELGDTLIAFFGFPVSHEDDALRAVRAVVDAHRGGRHRGRWARGRAPRCRCRPRGAGGGSVAAGSAGRRGRRRAGSAAAAAGGGNNETPPRSCRRDNRLADPGDRRSRAGHPPLARRTDVRPPGRADPTALRVSARGPLWHRLATDSAG